MAEERIKQVTDWFDCAQSARMQHVELWRKAYMSYRAHFHTDDKWIWPTKVWDPYFTGMIQAMVAKEVEAYTQYDPFLKFNSCTSNSKQADIYTAVMANHIRKMKPRVMLGKASWMKRLFGTVFAGVEWRHETRRIPRIVTQQVEIPNTDPELPGTYETIPDVISEDRTTFDGIWVEVFHITECYPDPRSNELGNMEYFIRRFCVDQEYVKKQKGRWKNISAVLADDGQDEYSEYDYLKRWQDELGLSQYGTNQKPKGKHLYEVLECRTDDRWITVVNRKHVVRDEPTVFGHKQLLLARNIPLHGELWGMSDYELIRTLISTHQEMTNAGCSEAVLCVMPPLALNETMIEDRNQIRYAPGAKWWMRGNSNVRDSFMFVERPAQALNTAMTMRENCKQSMDNAMATEDTFRGSMPTPGAKATSMQLATLSASDRLNYLLNCFSDEFMIPLGEMAMDFIALFESEDKVVKLTDNPEAPEMMVTDDVLRDPSNLSVYCVAQSTSAEERAKQKTVEVFQTLAPIMDPVLDKSALIREYVSEMKPSWVGKCVKSQLQVEQEQAMMMQQHLMAQQAHTAQMEEAVANGQPPPPPMPIQPPGMQQTGQGGGTGSSPGTPAGGSFPKPKSPIENFRGPNMLGMIDRKAAQ